MLQVDYPVYWTICEFCTGLCSLLNYLHIDSVSYLCGIFCHFP